MRQLPLSQDRVALVDDEDYDQLAGSAWFYKPERHGRQGAAIRHGKAADGSTATEYLARVIVDPPRNALVVHLNHDRLDCRRGNLGVVDRAHAQRQKRVRKDSTSGIKGVRYDAERKRWVATLWREGVGRHLGSFPTAGQADRAYRAAVAAWEDHEARRKGIR